MDYRPLLPAAACFKTAPDGPLVFYDLMPFYRSLQAEAIVYSD
jgi:hypothetical protein